jgi:trehalose 6-phosphate synthase/phosphatase
MKLVIIANRLPVKIEEKNNSYSIKRSEGGLATGLSSLDTSIEKFWVGWPGIYVDDKRLQKRITRRLHAMHFHPVFLSQEQIEKYYEGYSNSILWPLCHYFFSYIEYGSCFWEAYKEVNTLFCEESLPFIDENDIVWIQDYQLMLLPKKIRDHKPQANIGYFHHIPFPSFELFRVLPERKELLEGLLGADLIGLHTHDYMRHFISSLYRVLDLNCDLDEIKLQDRTVHVDAFPMGINYQKYHDAALLPAVRKESAELKKKLGNQTIILSVDRLDYSKGILNRIKGFAQFLENHPEYREKVSLAMIVTPSRDNVERYADLKTRIDQTIGQVNGKYATVGWTPIHYYYRSFDFEGLSAMYDVADIALVTPLRDGMNLVAKEYLASKREKPGVLILSEMAGAAIELTDAIIINPMDANEIENAILQAITMSENEKKERLWRMQKTISNQTVQKWANDFVKELSYIKKQNEEIYQKIIDKKQLAQIKRQYDRSSHRLLVLDYDGTLAPFYKKPEEAAPSPILLSLLEKMAKDPANHVVINSGRSSEMLEKWFGDLPIDLSAEHSALYKENGEWHENFKKIEQWDSEILDIIQRTIEKTPNSWLEIKNTALVWHYRKVDTWLANLREEQLVRALIEPCTRLNLQIVPGNKILEIKPSAFNKGTEIKRRMQKEKFDFVMVIGDDTTDEDMFRAIPSDGISIKVGDFSPIAKYRISLQSKVIPFLTKLIS